MAITKVDAPSVCAFTICSCGMSSTLCDRSRVMKGVMPMTISTTFEVSPSPKTMNRIGRSASGGTMEITATKPENVRRT